MNNPATSSVFRSSNRQTVIQPLTETLNYFSLPKNNLTEKDDRNFRAIVALSCIKGKQDMNNLDAPEDAMAYVLTVTEILFPGTIDKMRRDNVGQFRAVQFNIDASDIIGKLAHYALIEAGVIPSQKREKEKKPEDAGKDGGEESEKEDNDGSTSDSDWQDIDIDLGFTDVSITRELINSDIISAAARWGIEVFPIGKNVTTKNIEGFRKNRVSALQRALMCDPEDGAFTEDMLPRLDVLRSIERAFNQFKSVRLSLATSWAQSIQSGTSNRAMDAFLITFRMTDGYGLGAPSFILDLLTAYPELGEFPELTPQIKNFNKALDLYMLEAPELRGFVKVRYGANYRLFAASSRGALLALATAFRRQSDPSAGQFLDITPFTETIARANAFLQSRGKQLIADVGTAGVAPVHIS